MTKYKAPKGLIDRIFLLFPGLSYEKIGKMLGLSKGTIGGWRTGDSVPKLSELEKICAACHVDWSWLMTGCSMRASVLSYVFCPVFRDERAIPNAIFYDEARVAAQIFLEAEENDTGDPDFECQDFRAYYIDVVVSFIWASMDASAPDPMREHVADEQDRCLPHESFNSKARYAYHSYYGAIKSVGTPRSISKSVKKDLNRTLSMMASPSSRPDYQNAKRFYAELKTECANLTKRKKNSIELPVIGCAAADNDRASRAEFYNDGEWDTVQIAKEHYCLVRVQGDSMEPVILDGQYAMIGSEFRPNEKIRKQGVICIVQVDCSNAELPEEIGCNAGVCTFCKRVSNAGPDSLMLTSINPLSCSPFTVMRANIMHIWPIHGVIFAGHGQIPED